MAVKVETKADVQKKLEILLTATHVQSPVGSMELESADKLALFNALKPIITRRFKQQVKERMQKMVAESQIDLVEEVAKKAADGALKGAVDAVSKKR